MILYQKLAFAAENGLRFDTKWLLRLRNEVCEEAEDAMMSYLSKTGHHYQRRPHPKGECPSTSSMGMCFYCWDFERRLSSTTVELQADVKPFLDCLDQITSRSL